MNLLNVWEISCGMKGRILEMALVRPILAKYAPSSVETLIIMGKV